MKIELNINNSIEVSDVEPRLTLLDFIRDEMKLKGTHAGCEHGVCGACTIILNGEAVRSCMVLAVQAVGDEIITIEGINAKEERTGELNVLQDAFCEAHGMQCGYCTPGMVISAEVLLSKNSNPTREEVREAISGNICRCTGYVQIVDAIMLAAERLSGRNRK
tara:strand:+ start:240 stop:728 length:489 start_codon:yes stop_codon:yes gene_type:complete